MLSFSSKIAVSLCRCDGIARSWTLDNVDVFFDQESLRSLLASWLSRVEFAGDFLDISTTTSNDCPDSVHVWIVATDGNFRTISNFADYAHDFQQFHRKLLEFLAPSNVSVISGWLRLTKTLTPRELSSTQRKRRWRYDRGEAGTSPGIWSCLTIGLPDAAKVDIKSAVCQITFFLPNMISLFMFFISIVSDGTCLLAHFSMMVCLADWAAATKLGASSNLILSQARRLSNGRVSFKLISKRLYQILHQQLHEQYRQ